MSYIKYHRGKIAFSEYQELLRKNGNKCFFGITEDQAKEEFEIDFIETLIFSEKLQSIINTHMSEIKKEILKIYPDDKNKRDRISSHCGRKQMIEMVFKTGYVNEFEIYNTGLA
jgi:cyclopropane fatty-acyl-phospholipid synthase-like methyltransferase